MKIYALVDPRDRHMRYVGFSSHPVKRLAQHVNLTVGRAGTGEWGTTTRLAEWLQELAALGSMPDIVILEECFEDVARERESAWIRFLIERGHDLLNERWQRNLSQ